MFRNYLLVAWRTMLRAKSFSIINIGGLAIGLAVSLLIGLWIFDELSFDRSFSNYNRLARVYHHITFGDETMTMGDLPAPMGDAVTANLAGVEQVAVTTWPQEYLFRVNENTFSKKGMFVEPAFFDLFSLQIVEGSINSGLHSIAISRSLSKTLFGGAAIGKSIRFNDKDDLVVDAVFDDFAENSEFAGIDALLPLAHYYSDHPNSETNWEDYAFQCFALLRENTTAESQTAGLHHILYDHASADAKALKPDGFLFPMSDWHLRADFKDGINTGGQIRRVWMFGVIGIFVLLLACINFMNLSTARSEKRSKEVGIRKVVGSARRQLIFQFYQESWLMVTLGYAFAIGLTIVAMPFFNELSGKTIAIPWSSPGFIASSMFFILITSIVSGSYPALYLSSFMPIKVLKGNIHAGRHSAVLRKMLVVFQFSVSVLLIICTSVVYLQVRHAKDRPVGFDREGIIQVAVRTETLAKTDYNILRHELMATGVVENVASSDFPVTGNMWSDASMTWEGMDQTERPLIALNSCSHDFPSTNGFEFVEGRDFSRSFASDSNAVIINELAAELMAPAGSAVGMKIHFGNNKIREVVGVIKDQIRWTPYMKQSAHLYFVSYNAGKFLTIRFAEGASVHQAVEEVERVIKKFDAGAPFEYKFQDDDYARLFHDEEQLGKLTTVFASLAVLISCIGIFGLASYAAAARKKEIGIRKVLGASVFVLWKMLSVDFIRLVVAALVLGCPLGYYFASQWLQQYDYRIDVPMAIFIVTGVITVVITLTTVSFQALRAASINPVRSLRTE